MTSNSWQITSAGFCRFLGGRPRRFSIDSPTESKMCLGTCCLIRSSNRCCVCPTYRLSHCRSITWTFSKQCTSMLAKLVKNTVKVAQLKWFSVQSCTENLFLKLSFSFLVKNGSQDRAVRNGPNLAQLLINTFFPKRCWGCLIFNLLPMLFTPFLLRIARLCIFIKVANKRQTVLLYRYRYIYNNDSFVLADLLIVSSYYPGQKNRYSRDIHEIDPACNHEKIMRHQLWSATRVRDAQPRESRRCRTEARYRTMSHDQTAHQPHEFLGCNDFFGQGSIIRSQCSARPAFSDLSQTHSFCKVSTIPTFATFVLLNKTIFAVWETLTAWDSEIESLTSLDTSLIELDRRKTRRRHRVTAVLAPSTSCLLPCNAYLHASSASLKHGLLSTAFFFRMIHVSSSSARRDHSCDR